MQVLRLAEIRLAEDFSSKGAWEWVPETWKYTKFMQFWSSPRVSRLYGRINSCLENFVFFTEMVIIWLSLRVSWLFGRINSFLEISCFLQKSGHYWLWVLPWRFGGKLIVAGRNSYYSWLQTGLFL